MKEKEKADAAPSPSLRRAVMLMFAVLLASQLRGDVARADTEAFHTEYPSVVKTGRLYRMWYSAYGSDASGAEAWRIHYATSADGVHWQRHGVVLDHGPKGAWDGGGVAFPSVVERDGRFLMWYGGQTGGRYAIGLATSRDGIHWTRHRRNPVLAADSRRRPWEGNALVDPSVIYDAEKRQYMMWFNALPGYAYGLATSPDGVHWKRHPSNPVFRGGAFGAWDETGLYTAAVIKDEGLYKLWYAVGLNGRGASLGLATSSDGVRWTRSAANPFALEPVDDTDSWNSFGDFYYGAHVIRDGSELKMWVNAISGADRVFGAIAYGTSTDGVTWRKHTENPVLCPDGWTYDGAQPKVAPPSLK